MDMCADIFSIIEFKMETKHRSEHVALHEGLMLSSSPRANETAVAPTARRPKALAAAGSRRRT